MIASIKSIILFVFPSRDVSLFMVCSAIYQPAAPSQASEVVKTGQEQAATMGIQSGLAPPRGETVRHFLILQFCFRFWALDPSASQDLPCRQLQRKQSFCRSGKHLCRDGAWSKISALCGQAQVPHQGPGKIMAPCSITVVHATVEDVKVYS